MVSVPDPSAQFELISQHDDISLREGDTYYLVSKKWLKKWREYTAKHGAPPPGQIDNSVLLLDGELSRGLIENEDFVFKSSESYQLLKSWYGGGPDIPRTVRKRNGNLFIETMLKRVAFAIGHARQHPRTLELSGLSTLEQAITAFCKAVDISENDVSRIEHVERRAVVLPEQLENTLEQLMIEDLDTIVLSLKNESENDEEIAGSTGAAASENDNIYDMGNVNRQGRILKKPVPLDSSSSDDEEPTSMLSSSSMRNPGTGVGTYPYSSSSSFGGGSGGGGYGSQQTTPGLCGLGNLGNTCFMNSALQCLSNVPVLTRYLLDGRHEPEINEVNPVGCQGLVAASYAKLISEMWSGSVSVVSPREFKFTISKFAPRFLGYQQQDSQELLAFLLDGLHEDLNRIVKKPTVEAVETDGMPDEVAAAKSWQVHKLRNDSVIVENFQGQYKSTVKCPDCGRVSITFDPYMYVTVELPVKMDKPFDVIFVPADHTRPKMRVRAFAPPNGTVADIKDSLSRVVGVRSSQLIIADEYNKYIYKFFKESDELTYSNTTYVAYEVREGRDEALFTEPPQYNSYSFGSRFNSYSSSSMLYENEQCPLVTVSLLFRKPRSTSSSMSGYPYHNTSYAELLFNPIVIQFERGSTGAALYHQIATMLGAVSGCAREIETALRDSNSAEAVDFGFELSVTSKDSHQLITAIENDSNPLSIQGFTHAVMIEAKPGLVAALSPKLTEVATHPDYNKKDEVPNEVTLESCLAAFTKEEILTRDNLWYCSRCKEHRAASKKFDIWKVPDVLIIHLKRFYYGRYSREKIDLMVEFPVQGLNMKPYVLGPEDDDCIYDLVSISNHMGGLGGGHYTAYGKNSITQNWYCFDDSHVSMANEDRIVSPSAYLLFYVRRKKQQLTHL